MRRGKYRANLHPLYLARYDALCAILPEPWQPYCGARTFVEQEVLWHQGRTFKGPVVTYAKPGESAHNWNCASDWAYFAPGKNPWNDAPWEEYGKAVRAVGLTWAGDWKKFKEQPHNELKISVPWPRVLEVFNARGQADADAFIGTVLL